MLRLVAWHTSKDDGFILTLAVNSCIGLSPQHCLAMETIILPVRILRVFSVAIFFATNAFSIYRTMVYYSMLKTKVICFGRKQIEIVNVMPSG